MAQGFELPTEVSARFIERIRTKIVEFADMDDCARVLIPKTDPKDFPYRLLLTLRRLPAHPEWGPIAEPFRQRVALLADTKRSWRAIRDLSWTVPQVCSTESVQ